MRHSSMVVVVVVVVMVIMVDGGVHPASVGGWSLELSAAALTDASQTKDPFPTPGRRKIHIFPDAAQTKDLS